MTDYSSAHTFHIPVMGTGFTIDTPLRIARYGVSSVVSLVDDVLVEQMREFHSRENGEPFEPIGPREEDSRARRITAYLNLLDRLLQRQVAELQASPFEPGSEITRYFELLPERSALKQQYLEMLEERDEARRGELQAELRPRAVPGAIDTNIMTKLDRELFRRGEKLPAEFSDAKAALRGYAKSDLSSSIIFSAGMNPTLYGYIARFNDFFPDARGWLKKKIVLKVSDFRSAEIQGKFLAKKGLWVSEFRIESGLNCGGHAFASQGYLMGPILEEFKKQRHELTERLHAMYTKALTAREITAPEDPHDVRITVQGGIGTAEEQDFLLEYYEIDGTGWATPFLLVPEVTNLDPVHLEKLKNATESDVYLSDSSPLGIPFWNLRNSTSEEVRRRRLAEAKPGSPCPKGFLVSNTEFTQVPICHASRAYQKRKLDHLREEELTPEQREVVEEYIVGKSCICHDLAGGATLRYGIDTEAITAVCCGPNIVNFSRIATLEEMVGHIYGRLSLMTRNDRPHMFIRELMIYVEHLRKEHAKFSVGLLQSTEKYFADFRANLLDGVDYYRVMADDFVEEQRHRFLRDLQSLREAIEALPLAPATVS